MELRQPIILFRYFSFTDSDSRKLSIYPIEIESYNDTARYEYWYNENDIKYVSSTSAYNFKISHKKSRCEAEIFVEFPTQNEKPSMFTKVQGNALQLKHPYYLWSLWSPNQSDWKYQHVNTLKVYSVLVTSEKMNRNP